MELEQEDEDMQMATAMSLSLSGVAVDNMAECDDIQRVLADSLMGDIRASGSDPALLRHDLPDFLTIHGIQPNGWCFYDCVWKHMGLHEEGGDPGGGITIVMVAGLCLSCLIQRKALMEHVVVDEDSIRCKRVIALSKVAMYSKFLPSLDSFEIYILDKLESLLRPTEVLDTHLYADTPEIDALLRTFELSLLRLRPANEWMQRDREIGSLQGRYANDLLHTITTS